MGHRYIFCALALTVLVSLPSPAVEPIRIMTYNIHHAEGTDGILDVDRIVGVIRGQSPDIVCLQEVDQRCGRTRELDLPALLAEKLDMRVVYGPNIDHDGGKYGNATLTRYRIVSHENTALPTPEGKEQRGCLRVDVKVGDVTLSVFNTHLGLSPEERLPQARAILDLLPEGPAVVCGDLNETTAGEGLRLFLGTLSDSFEKHTGEQAATIGHGDGAKRIDFVLASAHLDVSSSQVIAGPEAQTASDHLPFLAAVTLRK